MSSVAPPLLTVASAASLAPAVELSPGDVIKALVLSLIKDTTFRLQLPTGILDVQTDSPLVPGTRVEIAVAGTQQQPTITLTPDNAAPSRSGVAGQASFQTEAPIGARAERASPAAPTQPGDKVAQAAATIVRDAATRQGGIAQLYADLEASFGQAKVALPPPVVAAARQLFALRLDTTSAAPIDADAIKVALAQSGLATSPNSMSDALRPPLPIDVRAVLLALREALKIWENAERGAAQPAAATPANAGAAAAAASPRLAGPALPYANGPTVPQPAADPSLPANATAREMALHLLDKTDAAIAREMLLKIASLPDRAETHTKASDTSPNRMTFDIPLATATGTTVAQLRIERDAARRAVEGVSPVWRASFSVDIEPIGAVHVRIALIGGKATVSFNAERAESAKSLTAGLPSLEAGLRKAELEPGVLSCQAGQPVAAAAGHGLYVDHAS